MNYYASVNLASMNPIGMANSILGGQPSGSIPMQQFSTAIFNSAVSSADVNLNLEVSGGAGASLGSKGLKFTGSAGGRTFLGQHNGKAGSGNISSLTSLTNTYALPPILGISLSMAKYKTRYWQDAVDKLRFYGSLYPKEANENLTESTKDLAFDSYSILESDDRTYLDPQKDKNDPNRQLGGTIPAYDNYSVLGQGISGSIRPYIFENGDLFGQNIYDKSYWKKSGWKVGLWKTDYTKPIISYLPLRKFKKSKVDFRFVNDFSNSLAITTPNLNHGTGIFWMAGDPSITVDSYGFHGDADNQHLAGSKHVEWFSNEEINSGLAKEKGFIECFAAKDETNQTNDNPAFVRALDFNITKNYLQPEMAVPDYCSGVDFTNTSYSSEAGLYPCDKYHNCDVQSACVGVSDMTFNKITPEKVDLRKKVGGYMVTNESGVTYHYALPVYAYNEYTRMKMKNPIMNAATIKEIKNDEP